MREFYGHVVLVSLESIGLHWSFGSARLKEKSKKYRDSWSRIQDQTRVFHVNVSTLSFKFGFVGPSVRVFLLAVRDIGNHRHP
jgi:hypothetical protein